MTESAKNITLEAPGAGLPPAEAFIARHLIFPFASLTMTREKAVARFHEEGGRALDLARSLDESKLTRPVLIDRFVGIEDSSRFWSAAMTLEHLILVGKGIFLTVQSLNAGRIPDRAVRIQDVKPDPETGVDVIDRFESWLDHHAAAGLLDLPYPNQPRLDHPWFGALDAAKWLKLNALHNGIHRKQIERIIEEL